MPYVRQRPRVAARTTASGQRKHKPDYILIVTTLLLSVIGLVVVYSISPGLAAANNVPENYYAYKQLVAVGLAVLSFILAAAIPLRFWRKYAGVLLIVAGIISLVVVAVGKEVNGASRWIFVGGLSFQAVELVKFGLLLWLADFLARAKARGALGDLHKTLKPLGMVVLAIGVIIAVLQSDLGSAAVLVAMLGCMGFVAGVPLKKVGLFALIIMAGAFLTISTSAYRRDRLLTFIEPERDCLGAGYQACQALIAVGSGGIFGKGLANSVQAYGYLPEAANDSIFAILAEKFGFLGVMILLGIMLTLCGRLVHAMERAPDVFSRLLIAGVLAWLSTQALINMGAMVGLLPLKGITLPFISYGGTSMIFVTAAMGLVFQITRYTSFGVQDDEQKGQYENTSDRRGDRRPHLAVTRYRS